MQMNFPDASGKFKNQDFEKRGIGYGIHYDG